MKPYLLLFFLFCETAAASGLSADEILQKTDEIRSPSGDYQMEVAVESPNNPVYRYAISIGGKDSSLIKTLSPSREMGKNYLMQNEHMWAYIPNLRRSVRVTLNQKLTGQAANGDISRMRWFGDYQPTVESENETTWTLLLKAKRKGLTYEQIRVQVAKTNFYPQRGEYLTESGKALKYIEFLEFAEVAGSIRPVRMRLESATQKDNFSILKIIDMKQQAIPGSFFSQANLRR